MEPRFTRGEYWLLETAVDKQFPVSALMANNLEEYLNNKKGHGLTRTALIETLHRLIVSGLISVEHEVDGAIFFLAFGVIGNRKIALKGQAILSIVG